MWSSSMPTGSSGAVSATAPSPWSRERSPAPAGRAPWRGEADQVAQPPPWRFQDSSQRDRDGGSRAHDKPCGSRCRPPRRRSECKCHALVVRPACSPLRCHPVVSPSPSSPAASTPQNLTSGRRLSRLAPKFLILEVIGLGKSGTNLYRGILQPGRYTVRSPRSGKGQLPSWMAGFSFDTAPSGTSPCVT